MNHPVETRTWNLIEMLLPKVDPSHEGTIVDAGVGESNWYFESFSALGYRTIAIEPHPEPGVYASCQSHNVNLLVLALDSYDQSRTLFVNRDPNLHSLRGDRTAGQVISCEEVGCISLPALIKSQNISRFTALKLDIEGLEYDILLSLPYRRPHPDILCFEFGGFLPRREMVGPWSKSALADLNDTLTYLRILGYGPIWAITDADDHPVIIEAYEWENYIHPEAAWGNIVTVRQEALHG